jgi:hypothetical protein
MSQGRLVGFVEILLPCASGLASGEMKSRTTWLESANREDGLYGRFTLQSSAFSDRNNCSRKPVAPHGETDDEVSIQPSNFLIRRLALDRKHRHRAGR